MYNIFFPTSKPYYVPDSGVTHADELLYLFNMNIPLLLCDLPSLASECFFCTLYRTDTQNIYSLLLHHFKTNLVNKALFILLLSF